MEIMTTEEFMWKMRAEVKSLKEQGKDYSEALDALREAEKDFYKGT